MSFQLGNLRFLDSQQFVGPGSSLDTLAGNLTEFPYLKRHFPQVWTFNRPEDVDLLFQKGVYPYSYMNSFSKFEETSLPSKEAFHSDLTNEDISEEKYRFSQTVWNTMGCETMGGYHDLYLYQDIFLLADIFEQFRDVCLKNYNLDPAHYYTLPGLGWDASLKFTKAKLQTLSDIEMHMFLERGSEVVFLRLLTATPELITSTCRTMTLRSLPSLSFIKMQTACMVTPCHNHSLSEILSGKQILKALM